MNQASLNTSSIYYRLIALWVLCEAMLGGIIHGFKLPVSGLFVGGAAVIIISLMAYYVPGRGNIIKATIVVAVFKMMLSPHSPFPAYIAVFFQGLLGELLFMNRRWFRLSCFLLALLSMIESAMQRLLMLTIFYGVALWKAIDQTLSKLTGEKTITNYSYYFAIGYIIIHIIAGIFVGWFMGVLPKKINSWHSEALLIAAFDGSIDEGSKPKKKKKKLKTGFLVIWILLIGLYLQSIIPIGKPFLSSNDTLQVLIKSIIIVLTWYFIIAPLVTKLMQHWLKKKQKKEQTTIKQVSFIMPSVKYVVQQSWLQSASRKGFKRFKLFCKILTVNIVYAA
jgi:hypothetical protein